MKNKIKNVHAFTEHKGTDSIVALNSDPNENKEIG